MLEFLKTVNISDDTIQFITNNFSSNDLLALSDNQDECLGIIALFTKIGIKNIDELLINESYIFMKLLNRVYEKISKYDIPTLVSLVNEDYTCIENYI